MKYAMLVRTEGENESLDRPTIRLRSDLESFG